jgi:hypothetical protein
MIDVHKPVWRAVAASVGGVVMGWSASALTIAGRVDAVEKTLGRIEVRLDAIATGGQAPAMAKGR